MVNPLSSSALLSGRVQHCQVTLSGEYWWVKSVRGLLGVCRPWGIPSMLSGVGICQYPVLISSSSLSVQSGCSHAHQCLMTSAAFPLVWTLDVHWGTPRPVYMLPLLSSSTTLNLCLLPVAKQHFWGPQYRTAFKTLLLLYVVLRLSQYSKNEISMSFIFESLLTAGDTRGCIYASM